MILAPRSTALRIERATTLRLSLLWATAFFPVGLHLPYFPVWLASRGLSDSAIALVLAVPLVLRVVATPLVAFAADRRGIAATLAICASIVFAGYTSLALVDGFTLIFVTSVVVIVAQGTMPALADALTLSEIRRLERAGLRRLEYGRMRVCASLSVLTMMLCSGEIVRVFSGERIVWALAGMATAPAAVGFALALKARRLRPIRAAGGLTGNPRALKLAVVCIAAAALTQASHAEIYAFGTLQWRAMGFSPLLVGVVWAFGVASESVLFFAAGRYLGAERNAARFLVVGAFGATLRWFAMSFGPAPLFMILLQAMHAASFAATYIGSVLLLGSLAGPNHRARMQGWLAAASSLALAMATVAAGRLTSLFGEGAYLGMAALAGSGLILSLLTAWMRRRLSPQLA